MEVSNGSRFSTWDSDNDNNANLHCVRRFEAPWWMNKCYRTNLLGRNRNRELIHSQGEFAMGITWKVPLTHYNSLSYARFGKTIDLTVVTFDQ